MKSTKPIAKKTTKSAVKAVAKPVPKKAPVLKITPVKAPVKPVAKKRLPTSSLGKIAKAPSQAAMKPETAPGLPSTPVASHIVKLTVVGDTGPALSAIGQAQVETKPVNPKEGIGLNKLPLHLWPASATAMGCLGILEGREKYGRSNFRATDVLATVYIDACKRHLDAYLEGEDLSPEGVPHLANALASLAILVDAKATGTLVDDRNINGNYRNLVDELTPFVAKIVGDHAGANPKHYTIKDKA